MAPAARILFVDDDEDVCKMFTRLFHRQLPMVQLIVLNSAIEALALLNQHAVDLVITDHTMPRMTGLALVHKLRACDGTLPIVMISGLEYLEKEALQAGVTRFLAKDKAVTELLGVVTALLHV